MAISITNESALTRTVTELSSATRHRSFADVRERDRGCIITKVQNPETNIQAGVWESFQAAHVSPLAYSALWNQMNFDRYITIPGPGGDNINSVQNRIFLRNHMHELFDTHAFSISPKVRTKIYNCFSLQNVSWLMFLCI